MPLYTFECLKCGEKQDRSFSIADCPHYVKCAKCGSTAKKILTPVAVQCDSATDVPWLESACQTLLPDGHPPLETRGAYKKYLKDNHIVERG